VLKLHYAAPRSLEYGTLIFIELTDFHNAKTKFCSGSALALLTISSLLTYDTWSYVIHIFYTPWLLESTTKLTNIIRHQKHHEFLHTNVKKSIGIFYFWLRYIIYTYTPFNMSRFRYVPNTLYIYWGGLQATVPRDPKWSYARRVRRLAQMRM
jgi:hypothetical protein